MTPEWAFQFLWFSAGLGGTGAVWYFLSQRDYHTALWTGFATVVVVFFTIALHIRNDLIKRELPILDSATPSAQPPPSLAQPETATLGAKSSSEPGTHVPLSTPPPQPEQPERKSGAIDKPETKEPIVDQPLSSPPPAIAEQPRRLSAAECDTLADLLKRGRSALNRLVAERASDEARAEAAGIQNETRDWLGQHLGEVHAEAFMSADPSIQVPANYPSQYGGIYQRMRGRLTHLTSIAGRFCQ